ncbi:MAG: hypothetical protein E7510_05130 [Ruminococcus sp.]|nr:hypothetical protein [Ruminococcus sp.]
MNIMMIIDSKFSKYAYVLVTSLIINHFNQKFNFYFVYRELKEEIIKDLSMFINSKGSKAYFVYHDCVEFECFKVTKRYPSELYCKIIPHMILPNDLDRILFMDVDMVVDGSLKEAYDTKFPENCCFIGCRGGNAFRNYYIEKKKDSVECYYINSGFMLINLKELRNTNVTIDTYKKYLENHIQTRLEEELLNYTLCNGEISYFYPFDYNYNVGFDTLYKEYTDEMNISMKKIVRHYMEFGATSKYGKFIKPWHYAYPEESDDIFLENIRVWWRYAEKSPNFLELYAEAYNFKNNINNSNLLLWNTNAKNFYEKLCYDQINENRFNKFIEKNKNKSFVVLKCNDSVAKYFIEKLKTVNINIVLKSSKRLLKELSSQEFETAKKADIIVMCCVHTPVDYDEFNGVKSININKIFDL